MIPKKILFVYTNGSLGGLEDSLAARGLQIDRVPTGKQALETISGQPYDGMLIYNWVAPGGMPHDEVSSKVHDYADIGRQFVMRARELNPGIPITVIYIQLNDLAPQDYIEAGANTVVNIMSKFFNPVDTIPNSYFGDA